MVDAEPSSPSAVSEERERSPRTGPTRAERIAVGGDAACRHPDADRHTLGFGAPLRFERCGRCGAVVVGRLGERAE